MQLFLFTHYIYMVEMEGKKMQHFVYRIKKKKLQT
jgi:hypothetical protein